MRREIALLAIVLLAFALCLSGCETIHSVAVKTPVPVYCKPPVVLLPTLPIDNILATSDPFQVTRALWASLEVYEAYATRLRAALDSCSETARPEGGK